MRINWEKCDSAGLKAMSALKVYCDFQLSCDNSTKFFKGLKSWQLYFLVKWITPFELGGIITISIYGNWVEAHWYNKGSRDLCGSPRLCRSVSVSQNQRFFISARGQSLHIPYFEASLLLMTHLPCLIRGSSTRSPSSDYRISLLHTPYNEIDSRCKR